MIYQMVSESILRFIFLPVILLIYSVSFAQHPGWTVYNSSNSGLPDFPITSIAIDGSGNKWIGTEEGGLAKFDGATWTVYDSANSGIPDNTVTSIAIDGSGNKWIGTVRGGLAKFDGAMWTAYNSSNSGLPGPGFIGSVAIDGSGNKWIVIRGGLVKFDGATWTVYNDTNSSFGAGQTTQIPFAIDGSGNKWIGSEDYLVKFNGATWAVYSNSGLRAFVSSIAIDGSGNKWIGTYGGGLEKFDGAIWTVYNSSNSGLPDDGVQAIAIDSHDNKWIGTRGGLAKFDGANWTVFNSSNSGLPYNVVMSIAIDGSRNIWIGTQAGELAVFSGNSSIKMNPGAALNPHSPFCWNYPNPFKQKTFINYNVLENGPVSLRIYSLDGYLVQTLVNAQQSIGHYTVSWDGKNDMGKIVARGVYLCQLKSNSGVFSKIMNFFK